jgi:hypothetical protein
MKNLSLIVIATVIVTLCSFSVIKAGFSGSWETSTKTSDFSLDLKQQANLITGSHISVMQNGNKIDSGADTSEITIRGAVNSLGIANVTFKSGYANNSGKATIKLTGNKLEWTVTQEPKGEYYIPKHAILSREIKTN